MVRAALLHLGLGFLFAGLLLFNKGMPIEGTLWRLLFIHVDMLIFGWIMQLAMGVAAWIVPRFSVEPRYGRVRLAWLAFVLLNAGVLVSAGAYWTGSAALNLVGHLGLLLAGVSFAIFIFPRIKPMAQIS
jgi:heme/copper-type cytochrome/quinol oxidase subunit 1